MTYTFYEPFNFICFNYCRVLEKTEEDIAGSRIWEDDVSVAKLLDDVSFRSFSRLCLLSRTSSKETL